MSMSLLTGHELEFLASLRINWRRLYCSELARLLNEDDTPCDARHDANSILSQTRCSTLLQSGRGGRILAFAPNHRRCGRDQTCQDTP